MYVVVVLPRAGHKKTIVVFSVNVKPLHNPAERLRGCSSGEGTPAQAEEGREGPAGRCSNPFLGLHRRLVAADTVK